MRQTCSLHNGYNGVVWPQAYVFMFQMTSISQPLVLPFNKEWGGLATMKTIHHNLTDPMGADIYTERHDSR